MNALVILAACVSASSAQLFAHPGAVINPAPSHQFHAQDEFGQFSFGHAGGPSARTEARNAYGVTTGSYQYLDAYGVIQTANYISDPVHGFRVAATNLPVGPAVPVAPEVAPLVAPVFNLPLPVAPEDTAEVAAAKAAHLILLAEATAAERKRRDADDEAVAAPALLPFPYAYGGLGLGLHHGLFAGAPGAIVAKIAPATPVEAPALPLGLPFGGLPYAGHGVLAAAAPAPASREAVLTTIKANPGHAIVYTVA